MDKLFSPRSIAIIGISPREGNLGRGVLGNLREYGYQGQVHLVGRRGGTYDGLPVRTSVDDLPVGIDLAVILTPAPTVPDYLEACGRRGIRRVCIESAGFDEFSGEGTALQARLMEITQRRLFLSWIQRQGRSLKPSTFPTAARDCKIYVYHETVSMPM